MPPPIQIQSGSRTALITWTVVSTVLFVVMTVLAIFASVDRNKQALELTTLRSSYESVLSESDLSGGVFDLKAAKAANPAVYTGNLLNVALTQRDNLARRIGGTSETDASSATDAAFAKIKDAERGDKDLKVPVDSLSGAVNGLLNTAVARGKEIEQLKEGRDDLSKKLAAVNAAFTAQLSAKDADVVKARENATVALTSNETDRGTSDKAIKDIQGQMDEQNRLAQETVNQLTAQQQEAISKSKKQDDNIKALQSKLRDIRQPVDQILRQADAHVMRIAGENLVYIDLGTGDQMSAGMSFEVYDRIQGIPKPGDPNNDENLPKGKASIEILKVSAGSSECRIVRQTPGETVVEGDLCVNLVYDRNVKYNVMVYGNFDLDRNGQATPQDADVIRRLVTRWGGKTATALNANTDFLVIGRVPELPNYTTEELDRPEVQFEVERKKKEIADYDDVLARAIELNIPVLNQNRFLYFTGYYEQSAR